MKLTSVLFLAAFVFVSVSARPCDKPSHKHKGHKSHGATKINVNKETNNHNTNIHNVDNSNNIDKQINQTANNGNGSGTNGLDLNVLGKKQSTNNSNQSATISG